MIKEEREKIRNRVQDEEQEDFSNGKKAGYNLNPSYKMVNSVFLEKDNELSRWTDNNRHLMDEDGITREFDEAKEKEENKFWRNKARELLGDSAPKPITSAFAEGFASAFAEIAED